MIFFKSHNPNVIMQLSSHPSLHISFSAHHFCSAIVLHLFVMLKIPHNYFRGYSTIHLRNESLSMMPLFGDVKVFPVLAPRSDTQCLLKRRTQTAFRFL